MRLRQPEVCVIRLRIGTFSPGNSGTYFFTESLREILPSSESCISSVAVKTLVIEATRRGVFSSKSSQPFCATNR